MSTHDHTDQHLESWDIIDLLTGLIDKSLVVVDSAGDVERLRMLETVREYMGQRLAESGEAETIRRKHAEVFLRDAEAIEPHLEGPDQQQLLDRLEADHGNLRAAFRTWMESPDGAAGAISLAAAVWWFWYIRGYWAEGRESIAVALAKISPEAGGTRVGKALYGAAVLAYTQGDYDAAEAICARSRQVRGDAGDRKGEAAAVNLLGLIYKEQSDFTRARELYEESLALRREIGDRGGIAGSLNNLGVLLGDLGEHAEALSLFEECLEIQRDLGHAYAIATTVGNVGRSALYMGDVQRAREMFEESLRLRRELGDRRGMLLAQFSLGFLLQDEGERDAARALFMECLEQGTAIGDVWAVAHAHIGLGAQALGEGDYARALGHFHHCLRIRRDMRDRSGAGEALIRVAQTLSRAGRVLDAVRLFGAGDACLAATGVVHPELFQREREEDLARTREAVGEETFARLYTEGSELSLEDAVAKALAQDISKPSDAHSSSDSR